MIYFLLIMLYCSLHLAKRNKNKMVNNLLGECSPSFCDSCRIQTCNLLIRSQMLYSVELRSHPCIFVGDDGFEPPTLCL